MRAGRVARARIRGPRRPRLDTCPFPAILTGPAEGQLAETIPVTPDGRAGARGSVLVWFATAAAYAALRLWPGRGQPAVREVAAWAAVLVLVALYADGARRVRLAGPAAVGWISLAFPLVALAAWWAPAFHSIDVRFYAGSGWLEARYGLDPYSHVPSDVPGWASDPMFTAYWADRPSLYGFLFAHLARGVATLSGGNLATAVALFQAIGAVTLALTAALLVTTARRLASEPRGAALFLLAMSPFLLVHHVANAHNDLLAGLFLLAAIRLASDGRFALAPSALLGAILVKWVAAIALPFFVVYMVRRHGPRRALAGFAIGAAAAALVSWRYLAHVVEFRWHDLAATASEPAYSATAALLDVVRALSRLVPAVAPATGPLTSALEIALPLGVLAFVALRTVRAARRPAYDATALVADSVLALALLLCLATPKYGPWYGAMFLPAALLLPESHALRRFSLWLSLASLLAITSVGKARILDALVFLGVPLLLTLRPRIPLGPLASIYGRKDASAAPAR